MLSRSQWALAFLPEVADWSPFHLLFAAIAALVAFAVVYRIDRPDGRWGRKLRSRLLFGVPWGTLVTIGVIVAIYLFVQSGIENTRRPVVIPFRAWSYFYPEGMFFAGLTHASLSHITGNLLSALVAGTIAEYAYGHYPRERGSSSFGSWSRHPYVRAFLIVPAVILVVSIVSSVLALGPVIGFSGAVFALWGFALVHYPLGTIVALFGSTLVNLLYDTLQDPLVYAAASPSYGPPSWANISIQGHAIGFLIGVLVALYLVRRRGEHRTRRHSALVVFAGILLFSTSRRFWAVYWYLGNEEYVLFRAIGLGLVVLLAVLVAIAVAGRDGPLLPSRAVPGPESVRASIASMPVYRVGVVCLLLGFAFVAGPSVLPNLATVSDEPLPGDPIEVDGYEVTYAENVPDQMVMVVDAELFGQTTAVETSGVIVRNEDRDIWTTAVSKGNLEFWGSRTVDVGGIGTREAISVQRSGWRAVGSGATYRVDMAHDDERRTAFTSPPRTAEPRIDNRTVSIAAVERGFRVTVEHDGSATSGPLPTSDEPVTFRGLTLIRENSQIYAERGDTRVRVLEQERYQGRERQ